MEEQVVTFENLNSFKRWLVQNPAVTGVTNLRFDVPLAQILSGMPDLTPQQQKTLGANVLKYTNEKLATHNINTMLDAAGRYPEILATAFRISGNSRTHSSASAFFSGILNFIEQRPLERNIPAIHALLQQNDLYGKFGTGEITKTSKVNAEYLNNLFLTRDRNPHAAEFFRKLDVMQLLNFDAAAPQLREYINSRIFKDQYGRHMDNAELARRIEKLDVKFFTPTMMGDVLNKTNFGRRPNTDVATDAKTQRDKNKGILPAYYTKVRDTLIKMADDTEIHDTANFGAHKTLSRRCRETVMKITGAANWDAIRDANDIIHDAYMITLQRDIMAGNADQLSPNDLQMVIDADKNNSYLRRIPAGVVMQSQLRLNRAQQDVFMAAQKHNSKQFKQVMDSPHVTRAEKQAYIDAINRDVQNAAQMRENLTREMEDYDRRQAELNRAGADAMRADFVANSMRALQEQYKKIASTFKDGRTGAAESGLATESVEETISQYLSDADKHDLAAPMYGALPLFGRGAEKQRRENQTRAIREFNQQLEQLSAAAHRIFKASFVDLAKKYNGKFLSPASLADAQKQQQQAQRALAEISNTASENKNSVAYAANEKKKLDKNAENLATAKKMMRARDEKLKSASLRHMGRTQTGKLTPVTPDMSPEEKRAARAKNRTALQDTLALRATKKKKPAKNLAEMLNNDIER